MRRVESKSPYSSLYSHRSIGCSVESWPASPRKYIDRQNFYRREGDQQLEGWQKRCGQTGVLTASEWLRLWQLYSGAPLGNQDAGTMTCYPTQLYYPDTEPTSPCPFLIMLSGRLGSAKYQFLSYRFLITKMFVLRYSNSISIISGRWYDLWDEKKARAYTFTD